MPEVSHSFETATGKIDYPFTNDFMFRAILQRNRHVLTALVCSVLHLSKEDITKVEILNPIELSHALTGKDFILDIRVLLNQKQVIDLEMQMANYHDWPERSISYAARSFDNLDAGADYLDVLPVHSIGFLNFTLFPDAPEFFATYQLGNVKTGAIYSSKFNIHVVDLTKINLATAEDRQYEIDRWAKLFKAKTWEELKMIAKNNPDLLDASDELYKVNKDQILREQARARADADRRERRQKAQLKQLQEDLAQKEALLSEQNAALSEQNAALSEQNAALLEAQKEIAFLKAQLQK